ncbi:MAG: type VI secretion system tip protein VgrG [Acidobacteria bacterium]|nr:type VI secretion system tip protein VgrG [Acidobacteriota bacterium]
MAPQMKVAIQGLGADDLLFQKMTTREEMSRLFEYELVLLGEEPNVDADQVLGKNLTVTLLLQGGGSARYFNGFVRRFSLRGRYGRYYQYTATVSPWLWFLTRTRDCRIFQDLTVKDIVKKVFDDHTTAEVAWELTGSYRTRTYCVQYRESDFNFVSRLLEEEGIGYYFRHTEGHHTLVLTDSTSKHEEDPDCPSLPFWDPREQLRSGQEHVSTWDSERAIQPGAYVHTDYDFERPSVNLKTSKTLQRTYTPSDYEVFDYPGLYVQKPDGEQYAHVRIDELGAQFELARGTSNARGLKTGALFTLKSHPRDDQNAEYLLLRTDYDLTFEDYEGLPRGEGIKWTCAFVAMPKAQQFRPARLTPKPFVQGPQTAVVVGPAGEEIFTDKYGRVKVQFHWDRLGQKNDKSSCWLRVSSPWAGKNWGAISLPRIEQEVIVDFLEGDPDQPIVTGRVYNAEQMPPYDLPANKTQSGVKSRSSMGGGPANFNEIRFEDKAGSEQLFIHAEKNQDIEVENDETHWVGHDRKKTIDHDETTHVKHDRTETVDNDETILIKGNRAEHVQKNEAVTIDGNRTEKVLKNESVTVVQNRSVLVSQSETKSVSIQRTHSVGANETITVGGAQEVAVGGVQSTTVGAMQSNSIGGNQSTNVGGNRSVTVGGGQSLSIGAGLSVTVAKDEAHNVQGGRTTDVAKDDKLTIEKKFIVTANDSIMFTSGDASIVLKKDGTITIKGKDITIEGSGKINAKASGDLIMKGSKIAQN